MGGLSYGDAMFWMFGCGELPESLADASGCDGSASGWGVYVAEEVTQADGRLDQRGLFSQIPLGT
jgi:hypothetical protein